MSIYPVRLAEWFPKKASKARGGTFREQRNNYSFAKMIVESSKCCVCEKRPQYRYAIGYHALPWGYATETIWCSQKCYQKDLNGRRNI